ncbi:MAG: hypothetical protein HY017_17935 [Betaproteobacteria bacterium]|nr:hypothetical protein [Betaproteobacteria bacterium]
MVNPVRSVLLHGYGVMGSGVAKTFAAAGFETLVRSGRAAQLRDLPPEVRASTALPEKCPDLILELAPEEIEVKRKVFREIEAKYGSADFLLATGTSGLDLNVLADGLARPERLIAIHYYMPAETIALVEVMAGPAAPRDAVDRAAEALERTGKQPLRIYQPVVGFIVNRLQHAMLHEAYWMITEGIATVADVDFAATAMLGPRMCASGLLLQKDISGLKVNRDAQRAIVPHLFHNNRPNPLPGELVEKGETGLAARKGLYNWEGLDPQEVRRTAARELGKILSLLEQETFPAMKRLQPKDRAHRKESA